MQKKPCGPAKKKLSKKVLVKIYKDEKPQKPQKKTSNTWNPARIYSRGK